MTKDWLHALSIIIGILGVLSFFGVGYLRLTGSATLWGMNEQHLFFDAMVLLLAAIWLKLGAIYHKS